MPSARTNVAPKKGDTGEPAKNAARVDPAEIEIAAVAYQLWLERGCPSGSDQEDWFRAEEILKLK